VIREGSKLAVAACALVALLAPGSAQAAPPTPFGHPCTPQDGVLFCPTTTLADRVPSFEGTPLDVDVTLPADAQAGQPLPTIVMLHGYGGSKKDFESSTPEGSGSTTYHYNNNHYAKRGYAVVNYTARGFGRSCGREENSNATPDCLAHKSYLHLADQRWEARDSQYLLGLLVDQQVTKPTALGSTGISYGGGQTTELAYLRDRIRKENGDFAPWTSPGGVPMSLAAAYPRWPWSDLVDSLEPNGRFLDRGVSSPTESREPLGIMKESFVDGLFASGKTKGTYCGDAPQPPCTDSTADLNAWYVRVQAGEPEDATAHAIADEIYNFHQGYGIPGGAPTPLLMESGFTDDLFPPKESIRVYRDARSRGGTVAMQFGDLGHQRGSNKVNADHYLNDQGSAFFDSRPRGRALHRVQLRQPRPGRPAFRPAGPASRDRGGRQPEHRRGHRPDRRRRRRLPPGRRRDGPGHGRGPRPADGQGLHAARAPHRNRGGLHRRPLLAARLPPLGRRARSQAAADQPRGLPALPRAERAHHIPAPRQRLVLCPRPPGQARAARQGRGLPAPEQPTGDHDERVDGRRRIATCDARPERLQARLDAAAPLARGPPLDAKNVRPSLSRAAFSGPIAPSNRS
jgi:hypothetical protein